MEDSAGKKKRFWLPTCAAELKAWVATVIWWSLAKSLTIQTFYFHSLDMNKMKMWIPSWTRWQQLKRYFKVSNPKMIS